jgi:uncharacterized protein
LSRKKVDRIISKPPLFTSFKPSGVPLRDVETITITLDELEAIKLADYRGLEHSESALEMGISRSTFSRLVMGARKKIAQFIIEGRELSIHGGDIHFTNNIYHCDSCGHRFVKAIDEEMKICPHCGSDALFDLAGGFGHGNCCKGRNRHNGKRR